MQQVQSTKIVCNRVDKAVGGGAKGADINPTGVVNVPGCLAERVDPPSNTRCAAEIIRSRIDGRVRGSTEGMKNKVIIVGLTNHLAGVVDTSGATRRTAERAKIV